MFKIEDAMHAELQPEDFPSFTAAANELKRRAAISWDEEPNKCPCSNWRNCSRNYQIVEYDTTQERWVELQRIDFLTVSASGVEWVSPAL
ncbi:hypothetical protein Q5H92_25405 [Hymenobacter sp. M29]|uniref:Uncharacterized protein n=1 Tax=Hymenobacter mellowenesis TaxID=3063995 RepID=A0ABT9AKF7_9BACT|nr:hypothetical protein [Hymenobacter sp. M29]MDO7849725.1 hypothetical protein [Hymenobacter sp. M29]